MIRNILSKKIEFGHTTVDAQHKHILDISAAIGRFDADGQHNSSFVSLLRKYRRNIKKHFLYEERLLELLTEKEHFSHKFYHSLSHKEHVNTLNRVIQLFLKNSDISEAKEIMSYAFEDIHLHILRYDNEMLAFMKIEGIFK